jgi:L-ascorbate metabolism protein UlaG (beta-lactamase superfamily)
MVFRITLVALLLASQGCSFFSAVRIEPRSSPPQQLRLSEAVSLGTTGAVNMDIVLLVDHQDFLSSSIWIEGPEGRVLVDPLCVEDGDPADLIFITHGHQDHLSLEDIDRLSDAETLIVAPRKVIRKLGDRQHVQVAPGQSAALRGVHYETVPAHNLGGGLLTAHPEDDENVGYVFELGGLRILHAGDTDRLPAHDALQGIDVALLPIDGGDLTMSTEDAAALVNTIQPRWAIPIHYALERQDAVETFQRLVDPGIEVVVLQP